MRTNQKIESLVRRAFKEQHGQVLVWLALSMTGLLGMTSLSVDLGHAYYVYCALQASTNAAALAGAQELPSSTATTVATDYSGVSGGDNVDPTLPTVTMVSGYPKITCLSVLSGEGITCVEPADGNAIVVEQQTTVPMFFARVFGHDSLTLTAEAVASARGSTNGPYNVVILVDTTESMGDTDSDSQCDNKRIVCALAGIQVLLNDLSPCASSLSTCGTATNNTSGGGANVSNSVDRVSIFTFPNITVGSASSDYCGGGSVSVKPYTFPASNGTTYAPTGSSTPTYEVVNFSSDYRSSDTATALSTTSDVAEAAGSKSGCTGMQYPGGEGTYYAGAIYAAQAALDAEKTANSGSQNVMIILSDGDAGTTDSGAMPGASTTSGTYPSTKDQCAQAVTAANAATTAGTRVYTVAYGAESSGCGTDSPAITPCQVMEDMASAPQYFFSDYTAGGSGVDSSCISASQPTSNLDQIFTDIATDFTHARLIPNSVYNSTL